MSLYQDIKKRYSPMSGDDYVALMGERAKMHDHCEFFSGRKRSSDNSFRTVFVFMTNPALRGVHHEIKVMMFNHSRKVRLQVELNKEMSITDIEFLLTQFRVLALSFSPK